MVADSEIQRIARLTPLADVLASFDLSVGPVEPREEAVSKALGLTLAASAVIADGHPKAALALRDGYAVRVRRDARRQLLCAGAAVARAGARRCRRCACRRAPTRWRRSTPCRCAARKAQALAAVAPGEGVLAPNADATAGLQLRLAGARLAPDRRGAADRARRRARAGPPAARAGGARRRGRHHSRRRDADRQRRSTSESGIAVTGRHRARSRAERRQRRHGRRHRRHRQRHATTTACARSPASARSQFHGIGITPGETTALGFVGPRPVLLLPGRIDAALAGWLTIGRRMLARRAFRLIEEQPFAAELARKIASPLGLAEIVAVRRRLGRVEPVAQGYLSMQALAHAEGWILIPADSEGHAARRARRGEAVAMSARAEALARRERTARRRPAGRAPGAVPRSRLRRGGEASASKAISISAPCPPSASRSRPRSAACWRTISRRRSTCRRSTAPMSTALRCAPPTRPARRTARRSRSRSTPR